jgi:hypothetical protein
MKTQVPAKKKDGGVGVQSQFAISSRLSLDSIPGSSPEFDAEEAILHPDQYNLANISIARKSPKSSQPTKLHKLMSRLPIQAKLTVGKPNDRCEQEADRAAQQVVQRINAPNTVQPNQTKTVQHESVPDEEDTLQIKSLTQRKMSKEGITETSDLESSIQQLRGGGQPLSGSIREPMERLLEADFSRVKVHTDSRSDQLNRALQAKAFTTKKDIFFRQGMYSPSTQLGQSLIAHELTHVVQQQGKGITQRQIARDNYVQRKVVADYTPEPNIDTINGVLETEGIDHIYELPEETKDIGNIKQIDRAHTVEATVTNGDGIGRFKGARKLYDAVRQLGKWERLAVSHVIDSKSIDSGHLVADTFYDSEQKEEAYEPKNLAPQDAEFNESNYRTIVENPITKTLRDNSKRWVKLKVNLTYGPDLNIAIQTLKERGALVVSSGKEADYDSHIKVGKKLNIPARLPTGWRAQVEEGYQKRIVKKTLLEDSVLDAYKKASPPDGLYGRGQGYSLKVNVNDVNKLDVEYGQNHPYMDISGTSDPVKMMIRLPERFTIEQMTNLQGKIQAEKRNNLLRALALKKDELLRSGISDGDKDALTLVVKAFKKKLNHRVYGKQKPQKIKQWRLDMRETGEINKLPEDYLKPLESMVVDSDDENEM